MHKQWSILFGTVTLLLASAFGQAQEKTVSQRASPFLPMDSYVYPLLDRLAAEGVVDTQFAGIRPWTRRQCAQLVREAEARLRSSADEFDKGVLNQLKLEFGHELDSGESSLTLDEIYLRSLTVGGYPLSESHLGQTDPNDNGRAIANGENAIIGLSATLARKALVVHAQGISLFSSRNRNKMLLSAYC